MSKILLTLPLFLALGMGLSAASDPQPSGGNPVDAAVSAALLERGIEPAAPCSDETFVRRVYLDVIGTLPEPAEVRDFVRDTRPDKDAALIDALLERPEFADYWSMKWCDILRVKSEFPINLWPNAVQAYHRWIHDALKENRPYDQFARQLLTSSGSNFRVPPVNFYRAVQGRAPADLAGVVALTFMGARLDKMPKDQAAGLTVFFSRVAYKVTSEWKEEIVLLDPAPVEPRQALLPDGTTVTLRPEDDPRAIFADWLIQDGNPWFARAVANRVWAWLMGRGIVHEPDDIRPDNPPAIPALLDSLAQELVRSHYDLRRLYRVILTSRTYRQSSVPTSRSPDAEKYFACSIVRRLDAEVLVDAFLHITGSHEKYSSPIPEPFTFVPEEHRTILLPDGSITSPFLEIFGRPARDTGFFSERNNECTDAQRLFLLNSSAMQKRIEQSAPIRAILKDAKFNAATAITSLYEFILSRAPTKQELEVAKEHSRMKGLTPKQAADDLVWALINSREFLYRH